MTTRLLILGGTAEARELAAATIARFGDRLAVVTSLAGRTQLPKPIEGTVRRGGFGGAAGLAGYLRGARIGLMIDATHPFAARISANARDAALSSGVPLLALRRPAWRKQEGDRWIEVDDVRQSVESLRPLGRRIWLTLGGRELGAFATLPDRWFLVRRVDRPEIGLPLEDYEIILGRGPFTEKGEQEIIARYRIDALVTRASGGEATTAKLAAARACGVPVVMIRRPVEATGTAVDNIGAALDWLARQIED